jgi:hypothetical protein
MGVNRQHLNPVRHWWGTDRAGCRRCESGCDGGGRLTRPDRRGPVVKPYRRYGNQLHRFGVKQLIGNKGLAGDGPGDIREVMATAGASTLIRPASAPTCSTGPQHRRQHRQTPSSRPMISAQELDEPPRAMSRPDSGLHDHAGSSQQPRRRTRQSHLPGPKRKVSLSELGSANTAAPSATMST